MSAKTVPVNVDARLWWKLAEVADKRGTTVTALVAELLTPQALRRSGRPRTDPRRVPTRDLVHRLLQQGFTDREIAVELHMSVQSAYYHRTKLGLPSNAKRAA